MEQGQRSLDAEQMQQQLKLRDRQKFFEEVFQHDVDFFFPMSHLQIEHRRPPLGSISSMEVNVDMLEQMDMMDLSDQDTVDVFLGCGTEESSIAGPLPASLEQPVSCPDFPSPHDPAEPTVLSRKAPGPLHLTVQSPVRWKGLCMKLREQETSKSLLLPPLTSLSSGADASQCPEEITLQVPSEAEAKSRISSTSSVSTDPNSLDTSEDGAETPVVQSDEEDLQEDSPKEQVARS
ncbi:dysbindin domain-containing protein 2 [Apteryx rowi]|uniref:dysbindin domain-containing protein 2 n=1 Tax=Apteryx rowi TaxID=308060 RepID=UPI000E1CD64D|nr:dysbindin domain-containing protein 2 [Apteryx rowi]